MNVLSRWRRSSTALAAAAAVVPLAIAIGTPATAGASVLRTATTTSYNTATYLHDELGFSATDTSPAIQPVTYDEFQWLLQQSGNSAFLIGDPGEDSNFATEAQSVETAAEARGVKEVYWFDPNLSGGTGTSAGTTVTPAEGGSIYEPNLDIRNPSGITSLSTGSQVTYGNAWLNIVGQYLGDGVTATPASQDTESAAVTATTGTATANDYGENSGYSTEIVDGNVVNTGGALYNYPTATASGTPVAATSGSTDSYFFIYNKANTVDGGQPEKIVSWVDLDNEFAAGGSAQIGTDVNAAINTPGASTGAVGSANLTDYNQFNWWESEGNLKQADSVTSNTDGLNIPLLSGANDQAADGGWKIDQITYPELVDLLKNGANTSNAVILFGGTWCPNTRPVIPFVNQYAQQNNVTVFNFDTVLDGGTVGGGTTSTTNPLQSRNSVSLGTNLDGPGGTSEPAQNTPTFLYGDLVSSYLKNIATQYTGSTDVTYYPGGVTADPVQAINKLQVPFLIGYQASDSGGITRQWIINHGNDSYTEYMSNWWDTNPQPNELGISIPLDAPIWSTINAELSSVTYATNPATLDANPAVDTDDANFLDNSDVANVAYIPGSPGTIAAAGGTPATYSATSNYSAGSFVSYGTPTATVYVALVAVSKSATVTPGTNAAVWEPVSPISISPANLQTALTALGSNAPVNYAAAKTALITAEQATSPNVTLISNLSTVVGAWSVAQTRKTALTNAWGNATTTQPTGVIFGLAADNALSVFFSGLPGGVLSTQTVTANAINNDASLQINVAIANNYGRIPTGNVSLVVQSGGNTVASTSTAVANNVASFTVPISGPGTYNYTLSYAGDSQIVSFSDTGTLTVSAAPTTVTVTPTPTPTPTTTTVTPASAARIKVKKLAGAVYKAAKSKKAGRYEYKVTITAPSGKPTATGKVTIKLKNGSTTKTVTGKLSHGTLIVTVPKLAAGTWKVAISWPGNSTYLAAKATGGSIKV